MLLYLQTAHSSKWVVCYANQCSTEELSVVLKCLAHPRGYLLRCGCICCSCGKCNSMRFRGCEFSCDPGIWTQIHVLLLLLQMMPLSIRYHVYELLIYSLILFLSHLVSFPYLHLWNGFGCTQLMYLSTAFKNNDATISHYLQSQLPEHFFNRGTALVVLISCSYLSTAFKKNDTTMFHNLQTQLPEHFFNRGTALVVPSSCTYLLPSKRMTQQYRTICNHSYRNTFLNNPTNFATRAYSHFPLHLKLVFLQVPFKISFLLQVDQFFFVSRKVYKQFFFHKSIQERRKGDDYMQRVKSYTLTICNILK